MKVTRFLILAAVAAIMTGSASAQGLPSKKVVTAAAQTRAGAAGPCTPWVLGAPEAPSSSVRGPSLEVALKLAQNTIAACARQGYQVGVTVTDSAGRARVTLMADGTIARAITTVRKACTATIFKMPTSEIEAKMKTDSPLAAKVASSPDFVAHTGAIPLVAGNDVIGGIGVSGAPTHEPDEECARSAVASLAPGELK